MALLHMSLLHDGERTANKNTVYFAGEISATRAVALMRAIAKGEEPSLVLRGFKSVSFAEEEVYLGMHPSENVCLKLELIETAEVLRALDVVEGRFLLVNSLHLRLLNATYDSREKSFAVKACVDMLHLQRHYLGLAVSDKPPSPAAKTTRVSANEPGVVAAHTQTPADEERLGTRLLRAAVAGKWSEVDRKSVV
jgi:hypothetical protein